MAKNSCFNVYNSTNVSRMLVCGMPNMANQQRTVLQTPFPSLSIRIMKAFMVCLHMVPLFSQLICIGLNPRVLCSRKHYCPCVSTARNWLPCLEGRIFVHIEAVSATLVVILYTMHNFHLHSEVREILRQANISPAFYFSTDALEWSGFVTNCEDYVERVCRTVWRH